MPLRAPDVVVVGSATRDLTSDDPRGWRLGGGVTFGALAFARLGLRTGVVLGLDEQAATAHELELLRDAGAQLVAVPLASGPVFTNVETPDGRIQTCGALSDPVPVGALPEGWRAAPAFVLAPVASEIPEAWSEVPMPRACVALAWQGVLRNLVPGERVTPRAPGPSQLLARADILAFSRHDVPPSLPLERIGGWLGAACDVLLTAGLVGGILLRFRAGRIIGARAYPSVAPDVEVDPTGAGDTMLAGLVAARLAGGGERLQPGADLLLGASAASLLVEGPGMESVPTVAQLRQRRERSASAS